VAYGINFVETSDLHPQNPTRTLKEVELQRLPAQQLGRSSQQQTRMMLFEEYRRRMGPPAQRTAHWPKKNFRADCWEEMAGQDSYPIGVNKENLLATVHLSPWAKSQPEQSRPTLEKRHAKELSAEGLCDHETDPKWSQQRFLIEFAVEA